MALEGPVFHRPEVEARFPALKSRNSSVCSFWKPTMGITSKGVHFQREGKKFLFGVLNFFKVAETKVFIYMQKKPRSKKETD